MYDFILQSFLFYIVFFVVKVRINYFTVLDVMLLF